MPFDRESRYMSKIHVILVVSSMYFLAVSLLNELYFRIKNKPISVFGYFIIHKLCIQKRGEHLKIDK